MHNEELLSGYLGTVNLVEFLARRKDGGGNNGDDPAMVE